MRFFSAGCGLHSRLCYLCIMKNIVFDLGGVVFARDRSKCSSEFIEFFSFIRAERMPRFWEEYDRGTLTLDEVTDALTALHGCPRSRCAGFIAEAIARQEPIRPTEALIGDLKRAGYRLYVLSNMSREFIDFLRRIPLYAQFDGEVVSCEEGTVKPEARIYELLLDRYGLVPAETLFIDDRAANIEAAERLGIAGRLFDHRNPQEACDALRAELLDNRDTKDRRIL